MRHTAFSTYKEFQMALFGMARVVGRKGDTPMSAQEEVAYKLWREMINITCSKDIPKEVRRKNVVSSAFKDYKTFYRWYRHQPCSQLSQVYLNHKLLYPDNRVYSADTCVLLPKELHDILVQSRITWAEFEAFETGDEELGYAVPAEKVASAFKAAKAIAERDIRAVAEKYASVLDERAYVALVAYRIVLTND
jgi:hypothetical protein